MTLRYRFMTLRPLWLGALLDSPGCVEGFPVWGGAVTLLVASMPVVCALRLGEFRSRDLFGSCTGSSVPVLEESSS